MTAGEDQTRKRIGGAIMQIRAKAAFFGVLAMHADYVEDPTVRVAATDGRTIYYNAGAIKELTGPQLTGLILHEVLHCSYLHVTRRGLRDPLRWNIAADYVVNSMVPEIEGAELPSGALRNVRYDGRRVEEVYDMLPVDVSGLGFGEDQVDIRSPASPNSATEPDGTEPSQLPGARDVGTTHESYWRNAINGALHAHNTNPSMGKLPRGVQLLVNEVAEPQVNWRDMLRDFTVHHPFDYGEFDLRLVGRGIYEEQLEGERLELTVCMDTSGSCVMWIPRFMGELKAMLQAFPHVSARLYYADSELHGPYEVEGYEAVPMPRGGGGTDFQPFFTHVAQDAGGPAHQVLVYLTDGYGRFPDKEPTVETVWVVTPGGLQEDGFPYGRTIKLASQ